MKWGFSPNKTERQTNLQSSSWQKRPWNFFLTSHHHHRSLFSPPVLEAIWFEFCIMFLFALYHHAFKWSKTSQNIIHKPFLFQANWKTNLIPISISSCSALYFALTVSQSSIDNTFTTTQSKKGLKGNIPSSGNIRLDGHVHWQEQKHNFWYLP